MALSDCIARALQARVITPSQAEQIGKLAEAHPNEHEFLEGFIQDRAEKKRKVELQTVAMKRALADVESHPAGIGRGVLALLVRDVEGKAPYSNVDYRRLAILADLHGRFAEAMSAYRVKNLGFSQDTAGLKRVVKELFGESSGDTDAAAFAKMWSDAAEGGRVKFNVSGGNVPARKDWGLPHVHDADRIAASSFEEWRDFIAPRLNRDRMLDKYGRRMSDEHFAELLRNVYDEAKKQSFTTDTGTPRGVPDDRNDHRLLTFKDSARWLEYNERYGQPDIYHAMMSHLDRLAGDIALMQVLGPLPDSTFNQLLKMAGDAGTPYYRMKLIRDSYEVVTGRVNQTESEFLAGLGTSVRNLLTAAQLGSSWISSFGDLWTARMTAQVNGISSVKFLSGMFKLMNPRNEADRVFAVKLGLGAEAWISRAIAGDRFGEITGRGVTAKIADTVMRASLLKPWTDAGKWAFGMELSSFVAENVGKSLEELPGPLQRSFARHGIDGARWDIIRRAPLIERDGAKYLKPGDIMELGRGEVKGLAETFTEASKYAAAEETLRGNRPGALGVRLERQGEKAKATMGRLELIQDSANKLSELFQTEMRFAFTEPDARVRAMLTQGQKRGSIMGEVVRSAALFKQFATSMVATHLWRGAFELQGMERARYLAELMVGLTVFGAASVQVRNVIKGKDPQDMSTPGFWTQAFIQSGGAGIFGDFLFSEANRFDKGPVVTAAGPVGDLIDDIARLSIGNVAQYLRGKETKIASDAVRFASKYTPGGNLFYSRLAMQRLLWDQLLQASDRDAHQSFRRIMQSARRDYGTEYWWRPGETAPERAPGS